MNCRLTKLPRETFKLKQELAQEDVGPTVTILIENQLVDLHPLVIEYIDLFQNKWEQWGVQPNVLAFKESHPS